ncbi:glycosyltransferase [Massilia sp. Mn16-1_5]|uniref:glycosyltransferase n=1 Tax=Massilia sp. Mn16-1_5 TaxID=2079199 RepID=UPI00109E6AE7|nr:glycosyltransferase [Massilia sp. Mn16-1_5]
MSWLKKFFTKPISISIPPANSGADTLILSAGDSASISYLVRPHLRLNGHRETIIDPDVARPWNFFDSGFHTVIISRYLPLRWIAELRRFQTGGGRIIYFMDDDLMDAEALKALPVAYSRKIKKMATNQFDVLNELCREFWVGSEYLATKYQQWSPVVLAPRTHQDDFCERIDTRICYHGTASHQAELRWLAPILAKVATENDSVSLEIFGDHSANKLFRDIPGAAILHPMSWTNYFAYTRAVRCDVGLAPLLPGPFNKGRGATKFFDYARMGAVGIYTDVAPYRGFIRHEIDGILLPNEPQIWERTVSELINDRARRERMSAAARERAKQMALA